MLIAYDKSQVFVSFDIIQGTECRKKLEIFVDPCKKKRIPKTIKPLKVFFNFEQLKSTIKLTIFYDELKKCL